MEGPVKGTVAKLSSLFPVEEAQKAAKRVEDTIAKRQKELDLVRDFVADNSDLINLVQKHRNSQRIVDLDQKHRSSEDLQLNSPPKQSKDAQANGDELPNKLAFQQDSCNQFEDSKLQSASEDVSPSDQSSALTKSSSAEKASVLPELKKNIQEEPQSKNKAFTGSIVEHTHNLKANPMVQITAASKSTTTQRSKPVSRFKMQRR